ncbi:MAG: carboxypeptidase-like regulatory domain-containing protein [Bacteroidia bacterium]
MKKIISTFIAIAITIVGVQTNMQTVYSIGKGGGFVKQLGEDDPIIMHTHVKDSDGYPVSGATVSLKPVGASVPLYSGTTDSNGDFTFDEVIQGSYQYKTTATGYITKNVGLNLTVNTSRTDTLIAQ